jgi:TRAP-type C4-dicarboxylate transport system permease small subunit
LAAGGAALIFFMMLFVTADSLLRYGLSQASTFGDELVAFMLVATVAAGLAYTWKEDGHLRVEIINGRLPDRVREPVEAVHAFLALLFSVVFAVMVWRLAVDSFRLGAVGYGTIRIPLWLPQAALVLGLGMLVLQVAIYFWKKVWLLFRPGSH